jgi:ribosomal protein S18 acetylase RimI-like enzyme
MEMGEEEARKLGARKMVLDVGSENLSALFFYSKLGFKIREEYKISFNSSPGFYFERMVKGI